MLRDPEFQEALGRLRFEATLSIREGLLRAGSREARTCGLDLLDGRAAALRKMRTPECLPEIDPWRTLRIQQADRGEVGMRIGHLDLLGLPC